MGTHQNKLDAKGRVSVPSAFRNVLKHHAESGNAALILRPSHLYPCIEAWPANVFETIAKPLQRLDLFSETHDDLAASLWANAWAVEPDKEGRVVLPESLTLHAGLTDSVAFVGLGQGFQVWEPAAGQRRVEQARERARAGGFTLPAHPAANAP